MKKITLKDILALLEKRRQESFNLEEIIKQLEVGYDSYVRVKIFTPGLFLEEIRTDTPIVGKSGITIKVDLFLTYLNRNLNMELIDDYLIEDLYLLLLLTISNPNHPNPSLVEARLRKPLKWLKERIDNKEMIERIEACDPMLLTEEDPEYTKAVAGIREEMAIEREMGFEHDPRITDDVRRAMENQQIKSLLGITIEEYYDPKTNKMRIRKKKHNVPLERHEDQANGNDPLIIPDDGSFNRNKL